MTTPTASQGRVFGLDVARALAISGVLVCHLSFVLPPGSHGKWLEIAGVMGVELFFILSGFLIGSILLAGEASFTHPRALFHFWYRRWMRTLPNYWVYLAVALLLFWKGGHVLPPHAASYLSFSQNLVTRQPSFFQESWSLAVEEWFYLTFPALVLLLRHPLGSFARAFLMATAVFLVVPLVLRIAWPTLTGVRWHILDSTIVVLRLDALMFGVGSAFLARRYPDAWRRHPRVLALLGVVIIAACWAYMRYARDDADFFLSTFWYSLVALGCALLLPACSVWHVRRESVATTAVRNTAAWSYSLYLCNMTVAWRASDTAHRITSASMSDLLLLSVGYLALSYAIAWVTYSMVERPVLALRDRLTLVRAPAAAPMRASQA